MRQIILLLLAGSLSIYPQYIAVLYNGTGASVQDKIMAITLAGIVNRDSARLYLLNVYETWSYTKTDEQWRDIYRTRGGVVFDSVQSIVSLLNKFRGFINGGISYDPTRYFSNFSGQNFPWQAEYAALIGSLTNRLPVPAASAPALSLQLNDSVLVTDSFDGDSAIWVTGRLEKPTHSWNQSGLTEEQRYLKLLDWGIVNLLPRCNTTGFYIREITDFTVSKKFFQVNLAGTDDLDLNSMPVARAEILERILTFMHLKNSNAIFHIYGWIRPEPMTQWFAHFGSSFHETLLGNLSWHSSFPSDGTAYQLVSKVNPDTVTLENKYYLLFITSEGDASNWVFGFQAGAWLSQQRGAVPLGWGWNFHLLDLCPFVAKYYYETSTNNDGFVCVTSPLGYAFPDLWGNEVWQGAIDSTKRLMNRFDVREVYGYKHYAGSGTMVYRGKTINNSFNFQKYGQFQSAINATLTMLFDPQLPSQIPNTSYGALLFNHVNDGSFYGNASDLNAMTNRILNALSGKQKPYFLLAGYQRIRQDDFSGRTDPGSSDISLPRLAQVVSNLKNDPALGNSIEVVTPQMFSVLMRKKLGLPVTVETEKIATNDFILHQNFPNPFNPITSIDFVAPENGNIELAVYDILGNKIMTLFNGFVMEGKKTVKVDLSQYPTGVYFYRLTSNAGVSTRKMLYIR